MTTASPLAGIFLLIIIYFVLFLKELRNKDYLLALYFLLMSLLLFKLLNDEAVCFFNATNFTM